MVLTTKKKVEFLVVDTTAFINNAPLQDVAENIITCKEVVDEIHNKRQLRRLVVLPYDLKITEVYSENVKLVTEAAKKTGDYPSLSATDIKVIALTYQLEKEKVGIDHVKLAPTIQGNIKVTTKRKVIDANPDVTGFFVPGHKSNFKSSDNSEENVEVPDVSSSDNTEELLQKFQNLNCEGLDNLDDTDVEQVLVKAESKEHLDENCSDEDNYDDDDDDDDSGWITPSNVQTAKKQVNSELLEEKHVKVACITTDFAMQNVLRQMNLNVSALDGRIIKQLRTYILRCYTCFKTTSIMTKMFCPNCGNNTLKKVAYSMDENGKMQIHINARRPLTCRGKKYSLPRIKGGKHSNNPILVEDQPMPDQKPTRLARTKTNALEDDYIAGFSPFVMRDVNSKSAKLCIHPGNEVKHWMRKNPNEACRKRHK